MSTEMQRVRRARRTVEPPGEAVRHRARTALAEAIAHDTGDPAPPAGRRRVPAVRSLAWVAGPLVAVVVALGAVVLPGHRTGRRSAPAAHPGAAIVEQGGRPLPRALDSVRRGLLATYGPALRGGDILRTALDGPLEAAADHSLARSITLNSAVGGSFVALNPTNGAIEALGSLSAHGIAHVDRAITDPGPVGSVFKPITALAALQSGAWSARQAYDDTGQFCFPRFRLCLHNSGHAAYGIVTLSSALADGEDLLFYDLGKLLSTAGPGRSAAVLSRFARQFGFGAPTGIDLPDEAAGTVANGVPAAVGQDHLVATPLQVAVAYAALETGGTVVRPHIGASLVASDGGTTRRIAPAAARTLDLNRADLDTILTGLRRAAASRSGTTSDVFRDFPGVAEGLAGTAEVFTAHSRESDTAWYAGFARAGAGHGPLVVAVKVDGGGFGAVAAAPVARQILSQWVTGRPGPYRPGTSTTL